MIYYKWIKSNEFLQRGLIFYLASEKNGGLFCYSIKGTLQLNIKEKQAPAASEGSGYHFCELINQWSTGWSPGCLLFFIFRTHTVSHYNDSSSLSVILTERKTS